MNTFEKICSLLDEARRLVNEVRREHEAVEKMKTEHNAAIGVLQMEVQRLRARRPRVARNP